MCLAMKPGQAQAGRSAALRTSNRNFEGRQGYKGRTHLVSPAMAAAAAIAGRFVDVRGMEMNAGDPGSPDEAQSGNGLPPDCASLHPGYRNVLKRKTRLPAGLLLEQTSVAGPTHDAGRASLPIASSHRGP